MRGWARAGTAVFACELSAVSHCLVFMVFKISLIWTLTGISMGFLIQPISLEERVDAKSLSFTKVSPFVLPKSSYGLVSGVSFQEPGGVRHLGS